MTNYAVLNQWTLTLVVTDIAGVFSAGNNPYTVTIAGLDDGLLYNVIAVSAAENGSDADQRCQGGIGPTNDGRRKPDLLAPSCVVRSARNWPPSSTSVRW